MRRAQVLAADPPWPFRDKLPGKGRGASKHYRLLTLAEICTFPLPPIADDAWLFLWRVGAMQLEALAVAQAWGFKACGELVWVKRTAAGRLRIGMGRAFRGAHETCLVAKRGRPERLHAGLPSVFFAERGRHSAKPDEFYRIVEAFAPGPRVELFARTERPGWRCLGDEIGAAA